jgi:Tol biopolymer transport system component
MRGVENIVFAARGVNPTDGHWYANFGYYADDPNRKAFVEGAKLYQLNLVTRRLTTLLSDPRGGVRDPQVSYDGKKILFSYRKGGTDHYHLYEIQLDTASENSLTLPSPQGEGSAVADADSFKLLPVLPRRETTLPLPPERAGVRGNPTPD